MLKRTILVLAGIFSLLNSIYSQTTYTYTGKPRFQILTTRNNWGPIGWRRDQWGATDSYLKDYLENNNRSFGGITFKTLIMERWKTAPVTGALFDVHRMASRHEGFGTGGDQRDTVLVGLDLLRDPDLHERQRWDVRCKM